MEYTKKIYYYSRMLINKITADSYNYINNPLAISKKTNRMDNQINSNIIKNLYNLSLPSTKIINNIYLGNAYNAVDFIDLNNKQTKLIVNCTEEIPDYHPNEFKYIHLRIRDYNDANLLDKLDELVDEINRYSVLYPDASILIHCYMGSSRSASVLIAYLIKYHNMDLDSAIKYVKNLRKIVNLNISFYEQLKEYERNYKKGNLGFLL